ncbi:MAG: ROK family protein [Anaerolineales bacterium]|jgi:glucokinase
METILGFDIGGTKIHIVEGDYNGQILTEETIPHNQDKAFEHIFTGMVEAGMNIIHKISKEGRRVSSISVSIGGPLDIEDGIIISPPNLPMWRNIPLKTRLIENFDVPVYIEHDGNAGALAEHKFGAGRGTKNLIFLTLGTGLGAGIIVNGEIYRGTTDTAGEVGHIRITTDSPRVYGKIGSWESVSSGAGLIKMLHHRYPGQWSEEIKVQEILQLALDGNKKICGLIEEMGEWLGRGIAILVDILNPEIVIIGTLGYLLGDMLLKPAKRTMNEEALSIAAKACRIVPSELGDSLGKIAALMAAITKGGVLQNQRKSDERYNVKSILREGQYVREKTIRSISKKIEYTGLVIIKALRDGKKVLVIGNGGSAAQAQHLAGELLGRFRHDRHPLPALALSSDSSVVTCIGNDYGLENLFSRQIDSLATPGDIVIALTTSGRSKNILKGLKKANKKGAVTIALTGDKGLIDGSSDYLLSIHSDDVARIQEEHLAIIHCWCAMVDNNFYSEE